MIAFIDKHFAELLLSFFVVMMMIVILVLLRHGESDAIFDWLSRAFDEFQGALLGLLTGVAIGKHFAKTNEANAEKK